MSLHTLRTKQTLAFMVLLALFLLIGSWAFHPTIGLFQQAATHWFSNWSAPITQTHTSGQNFYGMSGNGQIFYQGHHQLAAGVYLHGHSRPAVTNWY
ncbi:hypothetical protein KDA_76340 [Dictyobacter alpinus]|uniref:Uncharacterized protein n=1 Tax=Dictyobacter alpinus TaxID=2014873 RepID=A0A402BLG9_9CHLR|nr:hypothetical protein [Dictyobacter alpinus]GCE32150.1 hypothetical protein KDA_76340 [Dictyobacter alpinus]